MCLPALPLLQAADKNAIILHKHTLNIKIKIIHMWGKPRFAQRIGMFCDRCKGTGWQTYEQAYVDVDKIAEAMLWGSADGIDMDVVVQMRTGTSASLLEKRAGAG